MIYFSIKKKKIVLVLWKGSQLFTTGWFLNLYETFETLDVT